MRSKQKKITYFRISLSRLLFSLDRRQQCALYDANVCSSLERVASFWLVRSRGLGISPKIFFSSERVGREWERGRTQLCVDDDRGVVSASISPLNVGMHLDGCCVPSGNGIVPSRICLYVIFPFCIFHYVQFYLIMISFWVHEHVYTHQKTYRIFFSRF